MIPQAEVQKMVSYFEEEMRKVKPTEDDIKCRHIVRQKCELIRKVFYNYNKQRLEKLGQGQINEPDDLKDVAFFIPPDAIIFDRVVEILGGAGYVLLLYDISLTNDY